MSRMEKKKKLKKNKRYTNLILMMLFFVLISGIFATDYALKEMMALFDGSQLFVYQQQGNIHNFELFGEQFSIDQKQVEVGLKDSIGWIRIHGGRVVEKIKIFVVKMSG